MTSSSTQPTAGSAPNAFRPVITSLLETDLYKFTMWQALLHGAPANQATYTFVCRNKPAYPLARLATEVERQIEHLCTLGFEQGELDYLRSLRFIKSDFVDFLSVFRFQRRFVRIWTEGETLHVSATGPQVHVMGFEIYVLAIINELYFRAFETPEVIAQGRSRLEAKLGRLARYADDSGHTFEFSDFGLRRRFSGAWQDEVVGTLAARVPQHFKGTSNVHLARKYGILPIGTMAHEYLQTFQASGVQLRRFQSAALEAWVQEYRGDLGIALTDVIGMKAFLADFDLYFAKLFDGLRHDSGDPVEWGEQAIAHYKALRIDSRTKRLVFSDGLTIDRSIALYEHFRDRIQVAFGIGTSLTNDLGVMPLNIVMKLTECNGQPVAKLSDSPGKTLCDDQTFIAYLRQVFNHPEHPRSTH
jgi:nicotinate phosphoribosyltransferase